MLAVAFRKTLEQAVHVSLSLTSAWLTFAVADTASAVLVVLTIANVNTHFVQL